MSETSCPTGVRHFALVGLGWTLDKTADFPKRQRFTFGQRVDNLSLDSLIGVRQEVGGHAA